MALQPVTFRPITAVQPVKRKLEDESSVRKVAERKRTKRGRRLEAGQGENLDTWV